MKNEVKIGILLLLAFSALFVLLFVVKDFSFSSGNRYVIRFYSISGLRENALVQVYGGIRVGKVEAIEYDQEKARVHILVDDETVNSMLAQRKSQFSITTSGVMGKAFILLEFNKSSGAYVRFPRDADDLSVPVIEGLERQGVFDLLGQGSVFLDKVNSIVDVYVVKILEDLHKNMNNRNIDIIFVNLAQMSKKLSVLTEHAIHLVNNVNTLVSKLRDSSLEKSIESFTDTLQAIKEDVHLLSKKGQNFLDNTNNKLTEIFNTHEGIESPINTLTQLLQDTSKLLQLTHKAMQHTHDSSTPIGALFQDKKLTQRIHKVLNELTQFLAQAKKSYLFKSTIGKSSGTF